LPKPSLFIHSILLFSVASTPAFAQAHGTCAGRVIRYDAAAREAVLARMTGSGFYPLPGSQYFICDGQPIVVWVVHRRFKQDFSVSVDSTFQLSSGLPEIRGVQDATSISPPAAPPTQQAAATPPSKGFAPGPMPLVLQDVANALLDERTYRDPLTKLLNDADNLRTNARTLTERFRDYERQLRREIGSGRGPSGVDGVLPAATLTDLAKAFEDLSGEIGSKLVDPTTRAAEIEFDRITAIIDRRVNDVKRLQALQAYPASDTLAGLEKDTEDLVAQVRIFNTNLITVQTAVDMVKRMAMDFPDLVTTANTDMLRADLKKLDSALKDDQVNQSIAAYLKVNGDPARSPFLRTLPQTLDNTYGGILVDLPAALTQEGISVDALRKRYDQDRDLLLVTEVDLIDEVNRRQARVFTEINAVYWNSRIRPDDASLVALDLGGKSGNLFVYYSISVTDNFTPYQFQSDIAAPTLSAQAPNPATAQNPGAGNPGTPPAAKGTPDSPASLPGAKAGAPAGGNPPNTPPPAGNAASPNPAPSTPPAPSGSKKVFNSYVAVHHFTFGTVVAGFGFSSLRSYSYGLTPRLDSNLNPVKDSAGNAQQVIVQTDRHVPQLQYVIGIDYYLFGKKDMFPNRRRRLGDRFTPGLFVGTAMTELNHYFAGADFEPVLGFDFGIGYHYGKQTALQKGYYVGEIVPSSVSSAPTRSLFQSGIFGMVGFDVNIFKSVFGKVTGVGGQ